MSQVWPDAGHRCSWSSYYEYGLDYCNTDVLQNAALGRQPGRVEVLAYLIYEVGFPIDQIELEFLPDVSKKYASNGLGTALHSAIKGECEETLKFLLENGADHNKADTKGNKPIDLALQKEFKVKVLLLEQR